MLLFIFGCGGSSLLCGLFYSCGEQGGLFSSCGARALQGLLLLQGVGSRVQRLQQLRVGSVVVVPGL